MRPVRFSADPVQMRVASIIGRALRLPRVDIGEHDDMWVFSDPASGDTWLVRIKGLGYNNSPRMDGELFDRLDSWSLMRISMLIGGVERW